MASSLVVWLSVGVFGLVCLFLVFVFVCVASAGQSSDQTSESTNDSMSEVAKTARIVTMSAAAGSKKSVFPVFPFCCFGCLVFFGSFVVSWMCFSGQIAEDRKCLNFGR